MPRARSIAPPAPKGSSAPKGCKTTAQGIALGNRPTTYPSPEGAAQEFSTDGSPQGWRKTTFGELIRSVSINDKKLPAKQYAESGKFPVVDQGQKFIGGYSDDEHRVISDELPLIVFGDHTRIFKYLDRAFVPGADGIKVLKPIGVDAKWLFHIAHALDFPDKGYARHFQHLKQATVFVPPLPEQRRIVARIEELFSRLDAGVAALRHAKAQLQRYRQSVLAAAVTGQLTQAWREQHPETEPAEELLKRILDQRREHWDGRGKYSEPASPKSLTFDLPSSSWGRVSIDQLDVDTTIGLVRAAVLQNSTEEGFAYLKMDKIDMNGRVNLDGLVYVDATKAEVERFSLRKGDVLFNTRNSVELVGKTGHVASEPVTPLVFNNNLMRLRFVGSALPAFVALQMCSKQFRDRMEGAKRATTSIAAVYGKDLRPLPIALPPLAEQLQIVAEVEARTTAIDHLEAELDRQITHSNRLRQSTLAAAFSGNLVCNCHDDHRLDYHLQHQKAHA